MPSFEDEDGLIVYDFLVAMPESDGGYMLLPRWYQSAAVIADEGMVPCHHMPTAHWTYRPKLYRRSIFGVWRQEGSQKELQWRYGLAKMTHAMYAEGVSVEEQVEAILGMQIAEKRADELLAEFLNPYQRVELALLKKFHVRGAATRNLYAIGLGDGFELVDEVTHECMVSYCFHTEHWMPSSDIALATKFALEDEKLEVDTLENASPYMGGTTSRHTNALRRARDMERELIG